MRTDPTKDEIDQQRKDIIAFLSNSDSRYGRDGNFG